jgi:uncharacterized membrane protein
MHQLVRLQVFSYKTGNRDMTELQGQELIELTTDLMDIVTKLTYTTEVIIYVLFAVLGGLVALGFLGFLKKVI